MTESAAPAVATDKKPTASDEESPRDGETPTGD